MRDRRDRVHGPYRKGNRWRVVVVRRAGEADRSIFSYETEAEAAAAKLVLERQAATNNEAVTVSGAVEAWMRVLDGRVKSGELKAPTVERVGYHLRNVLQLARYGGRDLRVVTPALAARLYEERTGAVDSHRNGLSVAKSWGAWCVTKGWLKANPFAGVKGKGRRKRGKDRLTVGEAATLSRSCLANTSDVGAIVTLSYLLLGVRANELLERTVRDLDDGGRLLWIRDAKTQASNREIVVPAVLQPILLELARGRPAMALLFEAVTSRRRPADWAREQVARICRSARVPVVTPQGLRGTAATIARAAGVSAESVARTLGHSVDVSNRHYVDQDVVDQANRERLLIVLQGGKT